MLLLLVIKEELPNDESSMVLLGAVFSQANIGLGFSIIGLAWTCGPTSSSTLGRRGLDDSLKGFVLILSILKWFLKIFEAFKKCFELVVHAQIIESLKKVTFKIAKPLKLVLKVEISRRGK